jgi:hypothetical protein
MAILMSLIAQRMLVRRNGPVDVSSGTVVDVGDDGDGDRARGREGECLAYSWSRGDAQGGC